MTFNFKLHYKCSLRKFTLTTQHKPNTFHNIKTIGIYNDQNSAKV